MSGMIARNSSRSEQRAVRMTSEADEAALSRTVREAAVWMKVDGTAVLRLSRRELRRWQSLESEMAEAQSRCSEESGAFERLRESFGRMRACAEQAFSDGGQKLPASQGQPRVASMAQWLCAQGAAVLTEERLLSAVTSFDDVQPMTMAELWAVPEAVRMELSRAYVHTAEAVLAQAAERAMAEQWAEGMSASIGSESPVFFEYALHLLAEREDASRRELLERALIRRRCDARKVVEAAHAETAELSMRLENLLAAKLMLDELDWQACFETLSGVERELSYDPANVYARMEDDSKRAVREQTAILARKWGVSELTVARHAVRMALSAQNEAKPAEQSTVCYWLYDDEGRKKLAQCMEAKNKRLPKMVPDPTGRGSAAFMIALFALFYGAYLRIVNSVWFAGMGIPLAWTAAMQLVGRVFPRFVRPAKLLKLKVDEVPDEWRTLVVMPVLLSSRARAEEICGQMEALGCLEKDPNVRHLILGDFADAEEQHRPDDEEILQIVRSRVEAMNRRAGEERYFYLHRTRTLLKKDQRWMGKDRKRGALMDLNRVLLGEEGAEERFGAENSACAALKNRFRCVLTLDADTQFLPGTVQRLIGTMAHPLNTVRERDGKRRGFAVLQPEMQMTASACTNAYVRLFAGSGGMNSYPTSVSGYWQDVTGTGMFSGKGLYDVRAFHEALDGTLPEGKILSHDFIEGTLAGAAQVSDVCMYEGCPSSFGGMLKRLNRWTRGDWQLLPFLVGLQKWTPQRKRLSAAERLRLMDNLLRSLWAPSLLGLLIQSVWTGNGDALMAGLLLNYWTPVLYAFRGGNSRWMRATAELAVLPETAACTADAVLRTLWRLTVSKKHLLDWVTAADSEKQAETLTLPGKAAAILLVPGLVVSGWTTAAVSMGLLFLVGPGWISDLEEQDGENRLTPDDAEWLRGLAADTWRFFETYVNVQTNDLPPDNVQTDPNNGAADRTSPTNIGLYLLSCLSAEVLGFIDRETMLGRMIRTVDALEKMEKWRGHLYNWYDPKTLKPLHPRYVSSVDGGNLASALMLCAAAAEDAPDLARRMENLARNMDFAALYDEKRQLFRIGFDAESGRFSEAHYDLLASESRILSFTAILLGQVPLRHWQKLSRPSVPAGRGVSLASWSGTLFEYLMPELWMRAPTQTLLGQSVRAAIEVQKARGRQRNRPWGVSESGYYAFDAQLNYQYRAFGMASLSLGGRAADYVTAPYAALLALFASPSSAAANVRKMEELGWRGEYGMYEAADYLHAEADGSPRVVHSYMAHHQGMALCAAANVLTDDFLVKTFRKRPEVRAVSMLLEERPSAAKCRRRKSSEEMPVGEVRTHRDWRIAQPEKRWADAHWLGGAGASAFLTADGAAHYCRFDIQGTRFSGDLMNRTDGACVHVRDDSADEEIVMGGPMVWKIGGAEVCRRVGNVQCRMTVCISPEDGALIRSVELENRGKETAVVRVADCIPISLSRAEDMAAHPIFRHLFVESREIQKGVLMHRRRPRESGEHLPMALHLVCSPGPADCETDLERLAGRLGNVMQAGGIRWNSQGKSSLNPCSAWRTTLKLAAGASAEVHFAFGLTEEENIQSWIMRNRRAAASRRAQQLSAMQSQAMLGFLGLQPKQALLLGRLTALLMENHRYEASGRAEGTPVRRETLWSMGISGDLPMILVRVFRKEQASAVREAVSAHEYYRTQGLKLDLVLVNEHGNDYNQPVRDMIADIIAFSPLNERRDVPGGVHILEGRNLTEAQRLVLRRKAALDVHGARGFYADALRALSALDGPKVQMRTMKTGENRLTPLKLSDGNGYGGFLADGRFAIDVLPERTTPAPWSDLLANEHFGILTTERGGGFLWSQNSRSGRLTPFVNDALQEGWGWMLTLVNEDTGEILNLLPSARPQVPFRVLYSPAEVVYRFETEKFSSELAMCVHSELSELRIHLTLKSAEGGKFKIVGFVDWLMGTDARDAAYLQTWTRDGACFAAGIMDGIGYFASSNAAVRAGGGRRFLLGEGILKANGESGGHVLTVPAELRPDVPQRSEWVIGAASDTSQACTRVRNFCHQSAYEPIRSRAYGEWKTRMDKLRIQTPCPRIDCMANGWLIHQTLTSRIRAKTGLYQPGGACGFRDQLQDMLAILPFEPPRVRIHLLRCAAHQFEDGDVMHWWHEPFLGVRTKISDDLLFLPFVTAQYIRRTGDEGILSERIAYLKNVKIEAGKEDCFGEMMPSSAEGTLHEHCMKAFVRAMSVGEHGLLKMGAGDWNDGMNRVGIHGRGESIWLSEFAVVCAESYAEISPSASDAAWLSAQADQLRAAIECCGWDGSWYLRAFMDDGTALGGADGTACRIDVISQAWAVLADLDEARCESAMNAAWERLVDEEAGIVRLLTPPFGPNTVNPGYIASYPEGVRENGAQYTHAACWFLLALIRQGDARRAHRVLEMLLPISHSDTPQKARQYRVEPYVMAADVYDGVYGGRGGWTWYTGSAGWLYCCILELLGFERRGNRVRMAALLGDWREVSVTVMCGASEYRLTCRDDVKIPMLDGVPLEGEWLELRDDDKDHEALFAPRDSRSLTKTKALQAAAVQ